MIKITYEKLMNASSLGCLHRFFASTLTLPAWKKLRHTAAACDRELAVVGKKHEEVIKKHGGFPLEKGAGWQFPDAEKAQAFVQEWNEVAKTEVEIDGDPISLDDVTKGDLAGLDHVHLKPFFVD